MIMYIINCVHNKLLISNAENMAPPLNLTLLHLLLTRCQNVDNFDTAEDGKID